jgi:EpsI family protein
MIPPLSSWERYLAVGLALGAAVLVAQARTRGEVIPAHEQLRSFPVQIEKRWWSKDIPLSANDLAVLGPGDFLMRRYMEKSNQPPVDLYIAYFPSQRSNDTIHSPKNCLPGSGWTPIESSHLSITDRNRSTISINRYVIAKGSDRSLVFYWYQAHGRTTPSEYWAKFYLVEDAIRFNRTDGALVRVMSPITRAGEEGEAQKRALTFIQGISPYLDSYIPR